MRRTLEIEIDCGDSVCYNGERLCKYVYTSHFGTRWHCYLFGDPERPLLEGEDGMLLRCDECLQTELTTSR